ncbi:MAG: mechanosensitive ion channel [Nitrososphaerota archaeon]|nr:mechanosensitive ion channel [Nitrososphaerota archaeon]
MARLTRFLRDVAILLVTVGIITYLDRALPRFGEFFLYANAALILVGGVFISRELSTFIMVEFRPDFKKNAPVAANGVKIAGYIVSVLAVASYLSFSPTALLATAAFSGLVLGLALQPTLGSFFAGILVLLSGAVRPGNHVRILTWHIPFQWANSPGYKYFSPDSIYAGYMGEVKEVGLFFTKILTEEGQMMKIPNSILATDAAVLSYTETDYFFNVRYEFPNRFDPEVVLLRVREAIGNYPLVNLYVNEQSDKEYYIVKAVLNAKERDHAAIKSEILTRIIRIHWDMERAEAKAALPGAAARNK